MASEASRDRWRIEIPWHVVDIIFQFNGNPAKPLCEQHVTLSLIYCHCFVSVTIFLLQMLHHGTVVFVVRKQLPVYWCVTRQVKTCLWFFLMLSNWHLLLIVSFHFIYLFIYLEMFSMSWWHTKVKTCWFCWAF